MSLATQDAIALPDWFTELRDHQRDAINDIVQLYRDGVQVVIVDAPTGSGKTLIAEMVRRELGTTSTYVCTTKTLQDQVLEDYPYARKVMGRANYPVGPEGSELTADDCLSTRAGELCDHCETSCPYVVAKSEAQVAPIAVLNTAYWLNEANSSRATAFGCHYAWGPKPLIVVDECDTLETELMSYIEFRANTRVLRRGESVPRKGSHHTTIAKWLRDVYAERLRESARSQDHPMRRARLFAQAANAEWVSDQLATDDLWVRDNNAGPLVLKPVTISQRHGDELTQHRAPVDLDHLAADLVHLDPVIDRDRPLEQQHEARHDVAERLLQREADHDRAEAERGERRGDLLPPDFRVDHHRADPDEQRTREVAEELRQSLRGRAAALPDAEDERVDQAQQRVEQHVDRGRGATLPLGHRHRRRTAGRTTGCGARWAVGWDCRSG